MLIERKKYLEKLVSYRDKDLIKIVTGIRRSGKSTLLTMFKDFLINSSGIKNNCIISLNFDDYANEELKDPSKLYSYLIKSLKKEKMNYIFLDEIQEVKDFQKVVNSLFLMKNTDIYLSGSNSHLLSGEFATYLSGRYIKIEVLPLSFKEFISNKEPKYNLETLYSDYTLIGGFPYTQSLNQGQNQVSEYLSNLLDTIILKDIIDRNKIRDKYKLIQVLRFLSDNIGNELSINKIVNTLNNTTSKTIETYLTTFVDSYLIYPVPRYDIKGKKYLKTLEKYYIADIGLRNILLGKSNFDIGHVLENIVYLELRRRGYNIFVGKYYKAEVDFIAQTYDETIYIQVSATTRNEATLNRELASLNMIKDHNRKLILTLDNDPPASYNGIIRENVLHWLIND